MEMQTESARTLEDLRFLLMEKGQVLHWERAR
jgi:hypothetical protein